MHELYLFEHLNEFSEELFERAIHIFPKERREKALSYKQPLDRKCCAISYLLLLYGLREHSGIKAPEFHYGANGKPYLLNYPNVYFNISHCRHACVCAVSNKEIGVDVQDVRPYRASTARKVCCQTELSLLEDSPDKARTFAKIWCMKEAYVKMTGDGITVPLNEIDTSKLAIEVTEYENFFIAICEKT